MKIKRQIAEPMTLEQFNEEWDSLLRIFLVLSDTEFVESREQFSAPHPLQQAQWRASDFRYM